MTGKPEVSVTSQKVRHFIYTSFAKTAQPPSAWETAGHFGISVAKAEQAYGSLARDHHIALAPGTQSVWMAHPFSALPTNFIAQSGGKKYWGN